MDWLADTFEDNRAHLRSVAYRMLGSQHEADDAVQEAWLRLSRADTSDVRNLSGWLTTVVARVCLDMLRSRQSRREDPLETYDPVAPHDPEHDAVQADSVGLALLVVLETLAPAERLAFVLHDMFAMPFDEIAPIVGRTTAATRQLASRARRRVQGGPAVPDDLPRRRAVVDAFLAAARHGDFDALVAVLDPDVVLRTDTARVIRGASTVAGQARLFSTRASVAQPALVDGTIGFFVESPNGLVVAFAFTIAGDRIVEIDVATDPERLAALDLVALGPDLQP